MDKLFEWIKDFFTSRAHSIGKKLSVAFLAIISIFLINDYLGVSYYFLTNMEIEHFRKIEEAKSYCKDDSLLIAHFNKIEQNSLNRKTYIIKFKELFDRAPKENYKQSTKKHPTVTKEKGYKSFISKRLPEQPIRSNLWNTITSSFFQILGVFLAVSMMIYSFFEKSGDRFSMFLGSFFLLIISALLIWFLQWIFGLIPVIWSRAYINYALNITINILLFIIIYQSIKYQEKRKQS